MQEEEEKNSHFMVPILKKEFGNIPIKIISGKSTDDAYQDNRAKITDMALGRTLYLYENDIKASHELIRTIHHVRKAILKELSIKRGHLLIVQARIKRAEKSNRFVLEKGKEVVQMRYGENKKMTLEHIAKILNERNEPTPSGKGQWSPSTVKRLCANYLKLSNIPEKEIKVSKKNKPI